MFLGIFLELSIAWFLSTITNHAVSGSTKGWGFLILLGGLILVFTGLNNFFDIYLKTKVALKVRTELRKDTMESVLKLPQSYFESNHSGDLIARFTSDNQAVGEASGNIIMGLIRNPLLAVCAFVYLLTIHWPLALIAIMIGPLMILSGRVLGNSIRKNSLNLQTALSKLLAFLQDTLGSTTLIKVFAMERSLLTNFLLKNKQIYNIELKQGKIHGLASLSSTIIGQFFFLVSLLIAGFFVAKGSLEVGAMMAFIQLMNYLVNPFSTLPGLIASMQQALAGAQRIFQLRDETKEVEELPKESKVKGSFSELTISSLSFSYSESDIDPVIKGINLRVRKGENIAIVGSSGSGKSTLIKLLLGFYRNYQGDIKIDDQDIKKMSLRDLRDYFSLVPQDTVLFTGTIKENLKAGNWMATDQEIVDAIKMANAEEFISKLPQGINTEIGEKGTRLSGGQKQRISIARAILREAPILLLDEATAALDNKSEQLIQDSLNKFMSTRTTIVIAHRLSTVRNADVILVVENGEIVEQGCHEELILLGGKYHQLYNSQLANSVSVS